MATAALVAFSTLGLAAQPPGRTPASARSSARPAAHAATMSGTIQNFDPATGTLTLKEGKQEVSFVLASDATIREGSTRLAAADLAKAVGQHARVRYTGSGATRTAEQVIVSAGSMARKSSHSPGRH
jgi:hypothetical protein